MLATLPMPLQNFSDEKYQLSQKLLNSVSKYAMGQVYEFLAALTGLKSKVVLNFDGESFRSKCFVAKDEALRFGIW